MTSMQLYWFLKLDSLIELVKIFLMPINIMLAISGLLFIATLIALAAVRDLDDYTGKPSYTPEQIKTLDAMWGRIRKLSLIFLAIFLPLFIIFNTAVKMIPTTKQMAVIYVVPKIMENKTIQELPNKFVKLADEWIEEFRPENVKNDVKGIIEQTKPVQGKK